MDFAGLIIQAFEPCLVLVRAVKPFERITVVQLIISKELPLPLLFSFVLLVPFSELLSIRIFIFPAGFIHQYFVLFIKCFHSKE